MPLQNNTTHGATPPSSLALVMFALASNLCTAVTNAASIDRTEVFNGHTYHIVRADVPSDGILWTEAELFANGIGGHLVTVNNAAEHAWIIESFTPQQSEDFFLWIGLNDAEQEGNFRWSSGEPLTFTNFAPGEPNDFGSGEDYVYLNNFDARGWQWNDFADSRIEQPGFAFSALIEIPAARLPGTVNYESFPVHDPDDPPFDVYEMDVWQGQSVSILTPVESRGSYSTESLLQAVAGIDHGYDYYLEVTGRAPIEFGPTTINGRSTIALVDRTCGAGCGYVGFTGIEIAPPFFDELLNAVATTDQFTILPFYELGRNFYHYGPQLQNDIYVDFGTGYSVAMQFLAIDDAGLQGAPFQGQSYVEFQALVRSLIDFYEANPTITFEEAFNSQTIDVNGRFLSGDNFIASVLLRLDSEFGDSFTSSFWREVELRPEALTNQDALDNFFLAASAAAQVNLTVRFTDDWRWPISDRAIAEALEFGVPGDFNGDGFVTGTDFLVWQRDPTVGNLSDWQANYGLSSPLRETSAAVPEPASVVLVLVALYLVVSRR